MGWSVGEDKDGRDIGYGVPAMCRFPVRPLYWSPELPVPGTRVTAVPDTLATPAPGRGIHQTNSAGSPFEHQHAASALIHAFGSVGTAVPGYM